LEADGQNAPETSEDRLIINIRMTALDDRGMMKCMMQALKYSEIFGFGHTVLND
jgi:hypothetical protein